MGNLACAAVAALILAAAPAPEKKPEEKDSTKPVLIVKHKDYFVHAVWQTPSAERPFLLGNDIYPPLLLLLYTSTSSGQMKCLAASGHSAMRGPGMAIDRIHPTRTPIAGVVTAAEPMYSGEPA